MLCVNVSQHIRTPSGSSPTLNPQFPSLPPKVFMPVGSYNTNCWYKSPPNRLTNTTFSCESNSHSFENHYLFWHYRLTHKEWWLLNFQRTQQTRYNFRTNNQQSTNFDQEQSDQPQGNVCGHSESVSDLYCC